MGVVNYTCNDCGERCSDDAGHVCPGTDGDRLGALEDRCDVLERANEELTARVANLEAAIAAMRITK